MGGPGTYVNMHGPVRITSWKAYDMPIFSHAHIISLSLDSFLSLLSLSLALVVFDLIERADFLSGAQIFPRVHHQRRYGLVFWKCNISFSTILYWVGGMCQLLVSGMRSPCAKIDMGIRVKVKYCTGRAMMETVTPCLAEW